MKTRKVSEENKRKRMQKKKKIRITRKVMKR